MSTIATPVRQRFCYVKEGTASPYYEKPIAQVGAIARKHFGCSIPLWRYLISIGKVYRQRQVLDEKTRTWRQV